MIELLFSVDLEERDIGAGVAADDRRLVLLLVLERDLDFIGLIRDVMVGSRRRRPQIRKPEPCARVGCRSG